MKEDKINNTKPLFYTSSPDQIGKALATLVEMTDITGLDKSQQTYPHVKEGLDKLASINSSSDQILQESKAVKDKLGIRAPVHIVKQAMEIMHGSNKENLIQQAWELLLYQFELKITITNALQRAIKLQDRIYREEKADTPEEAKVLSQIIPEMLGSGGQRTLYESAQRQNGIKLQAPYKPLIYQGPEMDAKLQQYDEIKERTLSLYPVLFGQERAVSKDIIIAVAQKCLLTLHGKEDVSPQQQDEVIRSLLLKTQMKSGNA